MGLFNKIIGEAMVYAESVGVTQKYTYEQALEVLLNPKANAIELAKAENTMAMSNRTTGSEAKYCIGVALCKTHGLLTNATTKRDQMHEAADFLSASAVEAAEEKDSSSIDLLKTVMESDYAKSINLGENNLDYILNVKNFDGTEYIYLACANIFGWGCPVNMEAAREFLEKDALPGFKEEYHEGIRRLIALTD